MVGCAGLRSGTEKKKNGSYADVVYETARYIGFRFYPLLLLPETVSTPFFCHVFVNSGIFCAIAFPLFWPGFFGWPYPTTLHL